MYDDQLYQDYVKHPNIEKYGIFKYLDDEGNAISQISNDTNRKQLAWANFTGTLSKYIVDTNICNSKFEKYEKRLLKYYGRFLGNMRREGSAKGDAPALLQTEKNGISFINVKDNPNFEIKEEETFGKFQAKILYKQIETDFSAKILEFVPFIQNFNETASGANYGLKLLNNLFPFTDTQSNMDITYTLFFILQQSITWMKSFASMYHSNEKALQIE